MCCADSLGLGSRSLDLAVADFSEAIRISDTSTRKRSQILMKLYGSRRKARGVRTLIGIGRSIRSACSDERFLDKRAAVESATKACQLTQHKDAFCLETLANAQNAAGDYEAATATIDKAIALLKTGDKKLELYQSMRKTFQGNLVGKLGVEKFFEG